MATTPPTDQRYRPISFALEDMGAIASSVTLRLRPEDLTRTEPSRMAVHQTMGKDASGWVDDFGPGLPTINISGHTGWRSFQNMDGAASFESLHELVQVTYPRARQGLVDAGIDPGKCKLIFADMLDGFIYPVHPVQFVLRRSKSRPLLFQYQIQLQAIGLAIDNPARFLPTLGGRTAGLNALGGAIAALAGLEKSVAGWVSSAVSVVNGALAPVGATVSGFVKLTTGVFGSVQAIIGTTQGGFDAVTNNVIGIARDLAKVGQNVMGTIAAITGLPAHIKAGLTQVSRAFNEVVCIFSNSLRPTKTYEQFDGLYGASNCSSTTYGRAFSAYTDQNIFPLVMPAKTGPVSVAPDAYSAIGRINGTDPVLAPMGVREIGASLRTINSGVVLA